MHHLACEFAADGLKTDGGTQALSKFLELLEEVGLAGVEDMLSAEVLQDFDLLLSADDVDQGDTVFMGEADDHAAELRSRRGLDDGLSFILLGLVEHANRGKRVDAVH